jgi:hypothetical protein
MKAMVWALLLLSASQAIANPAPWYQWRSKLTGEFVCWQTSPGQGWEKATGPYKDPHCAYLIRYK